MRAAAFSAVIYVALTAVIGIDVIASLGSAIAHDPGDPLLTSAILTWNTQHVPWSGAWWQFPIFHPTPDALAFSEHMLGVSVVATPVFWLTGNPLATYNATLLLTYPLCGLAMYALVFRLTRNGGAAFLAGLAYAFAPFRVSQLPHLQLLVVFYTPLVLLSLHAFLETHRRRWLVLLGSCWMLQGAASGYMLIYGSVLVAVWTLWFVVASRRWRDLGAIASALALSALPLAPILLRYAAVHERHGFTRGLGEAAVFGADVASLLCAPPLLTFWGWLRIGCKPEGELYPGAALIALSVLAAMVSTGSRPESRTPGQEFRDRERRAWRGIAVGHVRLVLVALSAIFAVVALSAVLAGAWEVALGPLRVSVSSPMKPFSSASYLLLAALLLSPRLAAAARRSSLRVFYLVAAAGAWVLAWGPAPELLGTQILYQAPFAWLMWLPGGDAVRVPGRFWTISLTCAIVLMGILLPDLLRRRRGRLEALAIAVAACGLAADGWARIPVRSVPPPPARPDLLRGRVVLALPLGDSAADTIAVFRAVTGGWRTVNGFSGYEPAGYETLREASRRESRAVLEPFLDTELHVLVAEDATGMQRMLALEPGTEVMGRGGGVVQYRIRARR